MRTASTSPGTRITARKMPHRRTAKRARLPKSRSQKRLRRGKISRKAASAARSWQEKWTQEEN